MYAEYTKLKELFPFPKRIYLLQNWIIPYDCFLAVAKAQVTGLTSFFWLSYLFFMFFYFFRLEHSMVEASGESWHCS